MPDLGAIAFGIIIGYAAARAAALVARAIEHRRTPETPQATIQPFDTMADAWAGHLDNRGLAAKAAEIRGRPEWADRAAAAHQTAEAAAGHDAESGGPAASHDPAPLEEPPTPRPDP